MPSKARNATLQEAIAAAALEQLEQSKLRDTLIKLVAKKVVSSMRLEELAQAQADEHGAEVGRLLVSNLLRADP